MTGTGDRYAGQVSPIGLGRFLEEKIGEMIDQKLAERLSDGIQDLGTADNMPAFDVEAAVERLDDPQLVMGEWFRYEGREYPQDYGLIFFRGWATFSPADKIAAVRDAKKILDRSFR